MSDIVGRIAFGPETSLSDLRRAAFMNPVETALAVKDLRERLAEVEAERDRLREALERIAEQQPRTIATLRKHGIVFDGLLGADPENWQHVAFSIYTDLCEVDTVARAALPAAGDTGAATTGGEA